MRGKSLGTACVLALAVAVGGNSSALARGRGNNGAAQKKAMIAAAQQELVVGQQMLAAAEMVINDAQSQVSAATDQIEGARKTISDARSGAHESTKSQKSIEAEILSAQSDGSEYAKANLTFFEAQEELKTAKEQALTSDEYLAKKAAIMKEASHAPKLSKLQHDTLANDVAYAVALDKTKTTGLVFHRIKSDLLKANSDWVAAAAASKEAADEQAKANVEASKGAFKKMPAIRTLREARVAADEAREVIMDAQMKLRMLGAQPKAPAAKPVSAAKRKK